MKEQSETTTKYLTTIGLEIHAELNTASKMFCACKNDPDEEKPNVNVCSVCLGHPGTLPVLNKQAIFSVLKVGVAVDGIVADFTEWDRKNYFYPDIPKGYQISQYAYPLVLGGTLAGVELERIHLEEDTAQSTHDTHEKSLVNFNRAGVPLMELVTKPMIHDATTAVHFAKELQLLLRYLGASEANMEKGEMRVEANISVATAENTATGKFGTKTEVKNLNSFRAVEGAIQYEVKRQIELIEKGEEVTQETRGWRLVGRAGGGQDGETYSQRSKESAHDYRYFPDPDIPKLKISEIPEFSHDALKKALPELPWVKRERYTRDYSMTEKEVAVFVEGNELLSKYFEQLIDCLNQDKKAVRLAINYLLTDYFGLLKKQYGEADYLVPHLATIKPIAFAQLIQLIVGGTVNSRGAKEVLAIMYEKGGAPQDIAEKNGLIQKNDEGEFMKIIETIITNNTTVVAEYKAGKVASLQFLIGQAMKATKGSANPELLKNMLISKLS